ncbi:fimbrial assembly protein [Enterobacterales bacterium CwR94]|nr:fimbrial assembly protein [Enterobacterales bacterium CwR94]
MKRFTLSTAARPKLKPRALVLFLTSFISSVYATDYFNPAMLERIGDAGDTPDLKHFQTGGQAAGSYYVDVYINGDYVDATDVVFSMQRVAGSEVLQPCLSVAQLKNYGVRVEAFAGLKDDDQQCVDMSTVPDATAVFDFKAQALRLSIPQAALISAVRGYVAPEKWDDGLTAAIIDYSLSSSYTLARNNGASDTHSQYASLRPGINVGAWRFRNYSTYIKNAGESSQWESAYTYAQRGITSLKGQLTLGDTNTPGEIFDSVSIRGTQLASDDEMLPESQRGFAPTVRGIARGDNAEVVIRQNGFVIYQAYVPAGPFEIADLYPTGGNGDLYITVRESDGSEQYQVVPFASLPILQRVGNMRYALSAGQYRNIEKRVEESWLVQSSLIYGLPAGYTAYGGLQVAEHYNAQSLGIGKNLGDLGALSADITRSENTLKNDETTKGQSLRLRYSKSMANSGTNLSIAGYRYSTSGFYTLNEAFDLRYSGYDFIAQERRRNRAELTLTQSLGDYAGYISATVIRQDYWGTDRKTDSWSAGYSNSFKGVGYSINYAYNKDVSGSRDNHSDRLIAFTLSVPLTLFSGSTYAGYNFSNSKEGGTNQNISLSGSALEANSLSWSVAQGYGSRGQGTSGYGRANYKGTYGEVNGAYSYNKASQNVNYGAQGTLVIHEDGITAGQSSGETIALVKVPGASGLRVNNQSGVKTDYRGYALVPFISPYRNNELMISTESMPDDVDVEVTSRNVVPTRGAVVRATYAARVGQRALITLRRADGKYVPFGATASYGDDKNGAGIVGDQGEVYLSGLADKGTLKVKWGNTSAQQCNAEYQLPQEKQALVNLAAVCR